MDLFAAIANHVIKVHGGGPVDAFNMAEVALPWVGVAYRKDAKERPWLYGGPGSGDDIPASQKLADPAGSDAVASSHTPPESPGG